jgi:hypothetical protein
VKGIPPTINATIRIINILFHSMCIHALFLSQLMSGEALEETIRQTGEMRESDRSCIWQHLHRMELANMSITAFKEGQGNSALYCQ